jgi:hypothetical protein
VNEIVEPLESVFAEKLQERRRFAARNDQPIDLIQLLGLANLNDLRAKLFEATTMGGKVSLQCEDANFHSF